MDVFEEKHTETVLDCFVIPFEGIKNECLASNGRLAKMCVPLTVLQVCSTVLSQQMLTSP